MSVPIAASAVRLPASLAGDESWTSRTGRRTASGWPLTWLAVTIVATAGGSSGAAEFKSLLADAGTLVFGDPDPTTPAAAAPREPVVAAGPRDAVEKPTVLLAQRPDEAKLPRDRLADTPKIDASKTGRDADAILQKLLPPRSDTPADWHASAECLHGPGEPRALMPCVPPPPCDPSQPPQPFDLVGVAGTPSCGPIYRGPCEPRTARHHHGVFAWYHHLCDRMFDHFYRSK